MEYSNDRFDPKNPENIKMEPIEYTKRLSKMIGKNDGPMTVEIKKAINEYLSNWSQSNSFQKFIFSEEFPRNFSLYHSFVASKRNIKHLFGPINHDTFIECYEVLLKYSLRDLILLGPRELLKRFSIVYSYIQDWTEGEFFDKIRQANDFGEMLKITGKEFKLIQGMQNPPGVTDAGLKEISEKRAAIFAEIKGLWI